jgi:long-chain acyl-CoA synthetase
MPDALGVRASHEPDRVAHDDTSSVLTFAAWDAGASAVGGGLAAAGVEPGDRVLLPISNRHAVAMAVAYAGAQRAGAICVPVNTRWSRAEVQDFVDLVEPRWAITDAPEMLDGCSLEATWTVDAMPDDARALPDQATLPAGSDADADIIPTSGTTGRPKGVVTSHAEIAASMGDGRGTSPVQTILHAVPFTGYGGLHGIMLNPLRTGTTVVTQPAFDVSDFLRLAADRQVDALQGVPAMLRLLLDAPDLASHDLSSVRWIFTGTAPLPPDTVRRAGEAWPGARIVNLYGSTEAGISGGTQPSGKSSFRKPGSVGRPAVGTSVEVRGPDGGAVGPGEEGEIWIKTSAPPRRYWRDPEATAATWNDGWLRTGDLGFLDDDGDLTISGRLKDVIIRGGYNIAPVEIENAMHDHPAVEEAAVAGVPHEVLGEDVVGFVVLRDATLGVPELQAFLRARLASNKVPRRIVVVDELPRNAMGKVVKSQLPIGAGS